MKQKILFFIAGPNPTDAELAAAEKIGTEAFRYAGAIRPIDTLEKCDAVAGDPDVIPETYKAAYPVVGPAVSGAQRVRSEGRRAYQQGSAPVIVEDGTGVVGADSYATVAAADAYHLARGNAAWAAATNAQKEAALINASAYLDAAYNFVGYPATTTQGLQWPRIVETYPVGINVNVASWPPTGVITAAYELALRALSGPLAPDPVYDSSGGTVTSTSVEVGPLKKAQVISGGGQSAVWSMRKYPVVEALLRGYVVSKYNLIAERA